MALDFTRLDSVALLEAMHPGFFNRPNIRALPADGAWAEMALDLRAYDPGAIDVPAPAGVRFGFYDGDMDALRAAVGRVDAGWPPLFDGKSRVYCGFDGDRVASFCLAEDMGAFDGLRVGGPGCVGTLPEYRRRGIGLRMVADVTAMLKAEGYDVGYIHFTGVADWYARLGYVVTLRWNRGGAIRENEE